MTISRRWAVPAGVAAVVAAGSLVGPQLASARTELPPTTAAQLLARLARAPERPFSGTVVQTTDLGLPKMPRTGASGEDLTALVSGSTTVRIWADGPQRARAALIGSLSETDVVRNGRDVWTWNSRQRTAQHLRLPAGAVRSDAARSNAERLTSAMTPEQAARQAVAAVEPSTKVGLARGTRVAGRAAYEMVLRPRAAESLVGAVRIAIDAKTSMPLRVQVIPRGQSKPAFQTGFTDVSFRAPAARVFTFSPPAGSKVTERQLPAAALAAPQVAQLRAHNRSVSGGEGLPGLPKRQRTLPVDAPDSQAVVGHGWTAVLVKHDVSRAQVLQAVGGDQVATAVLNGFEPVQGNYGSGRLLRTSLLSVLWLDDGRLLLGAVEPGVLERAASAAADRSSPSAR
jgi:outer membrane lipoprotein-sorting protein